MVKTTQRKTIHKKSLFFFLSILAVAMITIILLFSNILPPLFEQRNVGAMPIALHPLLFDGYTEDFEDDAAGGDYTPINWYDTDWSYRQKYEIDDADIDNGANLVDFPVLITINSTTGGKCQADGGDLRFFSDAEGTVELDYDIEDFDGAGNSYVWVEIPSVEDNGAHTTFYMYYGNAGVANGEDESGTWNSNYVGVYHGVDALDATSNNNDGTATGGATYAAGHISNAFSLDGLNDWFSIADSASLDLSTAYTLESWIKPDTTFTNVSHGFFQTIFDKGSYNFFLDKTDGYATAEIMDSTLTFTRVKDLSSKPRMTAGTVFNGLLYAGQAWASNAGDIITWDGSNVATVYDNSYDSVLDMLTWKGKIYAGMGYDAGQGDVLSTPDGTTWDVAYNSGDASYDFTFGLTAYPFNDSIIAFRGGDHAGDERMMESIDGTNWYARYDPGTYMRFQKGFPFTDNKVYFGSGYGSNLADVHSYDGSASAKTYDGTSTYEMSASMNMYEGSLYSGFGESSAGEGDIYSSPDGSAWSLSYNAPDGTGGNPNLRGSWDIIYYKGLLWQGYDWINGRLVYFDGSTWTVVDPYNGGGGYDGMFPLAVYKGDFIVGGGSGTNDGDIFSCDAGDSVKSTTASFASNEYHYIASTYDKTNMNMYYNGASEATTASARTIVANSEPLYIGSFLGGRDQSGCGWFKGDMDEVRISNSVRNSSWLSATNLTITDPSSYVTFEDPEQFHMINVDSYTVEHQYIAGTEFEVWFNVTLYTQDNLTDFDDYLLYANATSLGGWTNLQWDNGVYTSPNTYSNSFSFYAGDTIYWYVSASRSGSGSYEAQPDVFSGDTYNDGHYCWVYSLDMPVVTTNASTNVSSDSGGGWAWLNGWLMLNGSDNTTVGFICGDALNDPDTWQFENNVTYGSNIANNTEYTYNLSGLLRGLNYGFCAWANNSHGYWRGDPMYFRVPFSALTIITIYDLSVYDSTNETGATLKGRIWNDGGDVNCTVGIRGYFANWLYPFSPVTIYFNATIGYGYDQFDYFTFPLYNTTHGWIIYYEAWGYNDDAFNNGTENCVTTTGSCIHAQFNYTIVGKRVDFYDQSFGCINYDSDTSFYWDFGDGAGADLRWYERNTSHYYYGNGNFTVTLTIEDVTTREKDDWSTYCDLYVAPTAPTYIMDIDWSMFIPLTFILIIVMLFIVLLAYIRYGSGDRRWKR